MKNVVEEAGTEERPLNGESSEQKVEPDRTPSISLEESHQETETDDNHNMCILEPLIITSDWSYLPTSSFHMIIEI